MVAQGQVGRRADRSGDKKKIVEQEKELAQDNDDNVPQSGEFDSLNFK